MSNFFFDPNEVAGKQVSNRKNFLADPCKLCGLYRKCKSPKMEPFGENKRNIMIVGEAPGKTEDEKGIPFIGKSGALLDNVFDIFVIDMDVDCIRTNVLQCRPPKNKFDPDKVQFCYDRLDFQIKEFKPNVIFCLGAPAASRIIESDIVNFKGSLSTYQGDVYISRKYNCWVCICYHPAYILRDDSLFDLFFSSIENGLGYLDMEIPESVVELGFNTLLKRDNDIIDVLSELSNSKITVCFDYETNCLSPFQKDSRIIYVSLSNNQNQGYVIRLDGASDDVIHFYKQFLKSYVPKLAQNSKFEMIWSRVKFGVEVNNMVWDTQIIQHIIDERGTKGAGKKSLGFLTFYYTGDEYKHIVDRKDIEKSSIDNIVKYSSLDARLPIHIKHCQEEILDSQDMNETAEFWIAGNNALHELEFNGILIDKEFYADYFGNVEQDRKEVMSELKQDELLKEYKIDFKSSTGLRMLFFDILNIEPLSFTEKQTPQVNEEFLKDLAESDNEYSYLAELLLEFRKLDKLNSTYSIAKYCDENWFLHPTYNLWVPRTFRSSCDNPNLQNVPKRQESMEEVRKMFIPRFDYLLEIDYKGAEVVVQAMLANDAILIWELEAGFDSHRYWASRLFEKAEKNITKKERYRGKNEFVFPTLYGASAYSISNYLGLPVEKIEECHKEFFGKYKGIAEYQRNVLEEYDKFGYVKNPLGFRRHAPLTKNQIINYPIQSTTFHCLLDSLIRLVPILKKEKFKSLPVLQVHDSIVFDVVEDEIDDLVEIIDEVTTNKEHWHWSKGFNLLQVEKEIGKNWCEMEEL